MATARRFAAIDVGTNTLLLLIAELGENGAFRVLEDHAEITRLGEGVDRTRLLGPEGEKRSLETLSRYADRCRNLEVDEIAVVGTSALRDARNAGDFKVHLKRELGLDLRILSGAEEAAYSYLAVQRGLGLRENEVLVVDVGGGSVELIWGSAGSLRRWASLDLGSVRLTERFLHSDPVRDEEMAKLVLEIDRNLELSLDDWGREHAFDPMVGVAGTFTTLAAVHHGLREYSHSRVHGSTLSRTEVRRQIHLYQKKSIAERKEMPGLEPKRADVILGGAVLIDRIMQFFGIERALVSDQGIRYGLLYERAGVTHAS